MIINFDSLKSYPVNKIDNFVVTNHLGVIKSTLKNISAVSLLSILRNVTIKAEGPKVLSEFYFVFVGSDDYKVVYSWNEIFNNNLGKEIFIVTEHDGKMLNNAEDRILVISKSDVATGRRHVKSLHKIIVKRVE